MGSQRERERELYQKRKRELYRKKKERTYNKGVGWGNNKKIEKIDYLNKGGDKIDELIWLFCKSECVK